MTPLILARWFTMILCGCIIGYAVVIASLFIRRKNHSPDRKWHVSLIALSYILFVLADIFSTLDSILHDEPFHPWQSPVSLLAGVLGLIALLRYLPKEKAGQ